MKLKIFLSLITLVVSISGISQNPDQQTAFLTSVSNNDTIAVCALLSGSPQLVDIKNPDGEPALVTAIKGKKNETARILIEHGADVNAVNAARQSPLLLAAFYGNYELCKLLLEKGANPDMVSVRGRRPVEYAAANGNMDLLNLFLAAGQKIDAPLPDGTTLLHWAANGGDTTVFAYILSHGLDINATDNDQATVMHWAGSGGDTVMLGYLVKKGLSIFTPAKGGWLPVQSALMHKQVNAFRFFLDHGIDLTVKFQQGNTIMHLVAESGNTDMMNQLLLKNPDINVKNDFWMTPLTMATMNDSTAMISLLIDHGAEVNAPVTMPDDPVIRERFLTPLQLAAMWNMPAARLLVEKGADINAKNGIGQTALHYAVRGDSLNTIRFLLENGAECNARNNEGQTPVFYAINNGNKDILSLLIDYGADINVADNQGLTPLHLSAINGYSDIAGILTDNKVNVIETDKNDLTPLDYAVYHGNRSTAALLEEHGAMPASALVFDNLLDEKLNEAEAIIYYLNYSSWAIKTRNHLLIIDYFPQNKVPDDPSVLNGRINPSELADKNVTVFSTHEHGDHYNEVIWEWEKEIKDIRYILGFNAPQSAENRFFIEPHKAQEVNGITVTPVISNDAGQGFMIETDGITLVHPGDLASSTRDISADYRTEIEYLANLNKHVDFLFLPVRGCSFPDVEAVILGDLYAIGKLKPRVVFPMHGDAESFSEFKERVTKQYKNQQVEAVKYRGDRYIYKKEKIQKAGL